MHHRYLCWFASFSRCFLLLHDSGIISASSIPGSQPWLLRPATRFWAPSVRRMRAMGCRETSKLCLNMSKSQVETMNFCALITSRLQDLESWPECNSEATMALRTPRWRFDWRAAGSQHVSCQALCFRCFHFLVLGDLISSSPGASCSPAKLQSAVTGALQSNGWEAPGPMLRARRMHHQWPGGGLPGPCPKWQKFHLENFNLKSPWVFAWSWLTILFF